MSSIFSSDGLLSESALNANFTPAGADYEGASNTTKTDVYPSEIRGLLHTLGTFDVSQPITLRGLVISESANSSQAMSLRANVTVKNAPTLYSSPPQGYAAGCSWFHRWEA